MNLHFILKQLSKLDGHRIKEFRQSKSITQKEFANSVGTHQVTVANWERIGKIDFRISSLVKIVNAFPSIITTDVSLL